MHFLIIGIVFFTNYVSNKLSLFSDGVLSLWNDVADLGLMGDVLSSLQTELLATLEGVDVRSGRGGLQETGEWLHCTVGKSGNK